MKTRKYTYLFVLQGYYAAQWDDLTASEDLAEVKRDKKAYEENEGGLYRIIKRRERN